MSEIRQSLPRLGADGFDAVDFCPTLCFPDTISHISSNLVLDEMSAIVFNSNSVKLPLIEENFMVELNVNWSDIGGQELLKQKLREIVEFLKHPGAFLQPKIENPKNVLMHGPPGCSKTMIAKALATESKLNFINVKGPELFSKWVGGYESAVREVFCRARENAPSIVFIDEIDAIGGEKSSDNASNNVQERFLTQLLTELDGVTELGNVKLLAATNKLDRVDEALLEPGRFGTVIEVPLPDSQTREEIFKIHLKKVPIDESVVINDLVEKTEGYSGAEIRALCQEAVFNALLENTYAKKITKDHFEQGLKVVKPRTNTNLPKLYVDFDNIDISNIFSF